MPRQVVQVRADLAQAPDRVWQTLRDFAAPWHPWIATMLAERGPHGAPIRAFTVKGEDTPYREQQTYLSDSDRVLGYRHLEGIADCQAYDARVHVTPREGGGSHIDWSTTVVAAEPRLTAICTGTRAVFEAGIAELARLPRTDPPPPAPDGTRARVETLIFDDLPRLALSVTPDLGDGRLCLFLHGIGGRRSNWQAQLEAVGPTMRAAALDLRGYGDSSLGARQSMIDDYCADILRVAEKLGARRLVLVGLSYGSWIATSFAMRHPGMLDALVLSGGCTGMSEADPEERENFRVSREVPLDAGQVPADFAPSVVAVIAGPNADEATRQALFDSMAAIPVATYRDALNCFTNPLERFDFARLTMPVLMMTGTHDRLAPPVEIRGVAARICDAAPLPDVRFEMIAGAGHVCNLENPAIYTSHLLDLLRRLS